MKDVNGFFAIISIIILKFPSKSNVTSDEFSSTASIEIVKVYSKAGAGDSKTIFDGSTVSFKRIPTFGKAPTPTVKPFPDS